MTDYSKYSAGDFLADESFVNYLVQNDKEDIQHWENWIKRNPECRNVVKEAGLLYFLIRDQSEAPKSNDLAESQFAQLQSLIKKEDSEYDDKVIPIKGEKSKFRKIRSIKFVWRVAAVACVILIALFSWMYFGSPINLNEKPTSILFAKTDNVSEKVTLPDSSEVILNSNSSVAISKDFNKTKREVTLIGSAYFKVKKNHSKPFIVTSGSLKTTAVGTAFYIYNLHAQSASVSLLEGKVKIQGEKNSIYLMPGEKAVLNGEEMVLKKSFNKEQLRNFTNGKIVFEHAGLQDIKNVLGEYFNIDVKIEGSIPSMNFTGDFDSNNIQSILKALQFTYNINYKIEEKELVLSF